MSSPLLLVVDLQCLCSKTSWDFPSQHIQQPAAHSLGCIWHFSSDPAAPPLRGLLPSVSEAVPWALNVVSIFLTKEVKELFHFTMLPRLNYLSMQP